MSRPPRMRDVAELAGVGTMTVSRVLSGQGHVAEEMRERVFRAVEQLNYRPNEVARSLRDARSRQIGIVVPNISDPFFATCADAISTVARQHGYSVIMTTTEENPEVEFNEVSLMLRRNVDGVIAIPAQSEDSRLASPEFERIPLVALGRPIDDPAQQEAEAELRFDTVLVDNEPASYQAVKHLIGHGHTRIVCLALTRQLYTTRARYAGYVRAMEEAGLPVQEDFLSADRDEMLLRVRMTLSKRQAPTAFFCASNTVTRNLMHALAKLELSVPKDVAVIGFDDFDTASILNPPMTVVRQPLVEMGRLAAEMLFARLVAKTGEPREAGRQMTLPAELVVRRSCGCSV